jgi:hypothetical protein
MFENQILEVEKNCKKIIQVFRDGNFTFWKKRGDMCASRDIIELSELIKEGWIIE